MSKSFDRAVRPHQAQHSAGQLQPSAILPTTGTAQCLPSIGCTPKTTHRLDPSGRVKAGMASFFNPSAQTRHIDSAPVEFLVCWVFGGTLCAAGPWYSNPSSYISTWTGKLLATVLTSACKNGKGPQHGFCCPVQPCISTCVHMIHHTLITDNAPTFDHVRLDGTS
jgi:hypothetical protein